MSVLKLCEFPWDILLRSSIAWVAMRWGRAVFEPCLGLVFAFFRPKFGPRRLLKLLFLKNHDFHADLRFPMFFHQNRPQDEAKIGLRSPQDSSKTDLNRSKNRPQIARSLLGDSWAILGRSWGDLWAVLGRSWAVLGGLGAVLGRSWAVLGLCWGGLVAVLGGLGAVLGGLGRFWAVLLSLIHI